MAGITDDNFLVMNQGKNPLVNFNFMLRVEMIYDLPCKSVRAFSRELEYDFIQEGGLNDYVHMRRKPISKPFTLEIERYVGVDYIDPLPLGADLVLPVILFVSRSHSQFIPGVVARTYTFTGCTVMKKTYGDLVADQSGLLVETTTIGYREMVCVDIPWSEVGDNIYGSTPTVPTNARSLDQSAVDLKAMGQLLYNQALEAKNQSDAEFVPADLDAVIQQLENATGYLVGAVSSGGALQTAVTDAEKTLNGTGGTTLREAADESWQAALAKEIAAKEAEQVWREKDGPYQEALREAAQLQEQLTELTAQVTDLTAQLERNRGEEASIKEKLPENAKTPQDAQRALSTAQSAYDRADMAVEQALEKAKAERDLASVIDEPAKGSKLDDLQAKIDAASEQRNAAKTELDAAARAVEDHERLAVLSGSIKDAEGKLKAAQAGVTAATSGKTAAEQKAANAENAANTAKTAYDKAKTEWETALRKAEKDLEAVETADRNLAQANKNLSDATRSARALQNHLTNLRSRKKLASEAQADCTAQHEQCQSANSTLQGLPDEPLAEVNRYYETVKKHSKQTVFHERQVRDTVQYVASAQETLAEVDAFLPRAGTVGG